MRTIGYDYAELARIAPQINDRILRFDVYRKRRRMDGTRYDECIISFDEIENALAFVGNTDIWYGQDLCVREVDVLSDDAVCVLAAEWHEEVLGGRYLN
jgi:hypothetical protein